MTKASQHLEWNVGEEQFLRTLAAPPEQVSAQRRQGLLGRGLRIFVVIAVMFGVGSSAAPQQDTLLTEQNLDEQNLSEVEQQRIRDLLALDGVSLTPPNVLDETSAELLEYDRSFVRSVTEKCCQEEEPSLQRRVLVTRLNRMERPAGKPTPAIFGASQPTAQDHLLSVKVQGGYAVATILVDNPRDEFWPYGSYREKRIYQQADGEWAQVEPAGDLAESQHLVETAHLRFEFSELDAATFGPVTDEIEQKYQELHTLLGLPLSAGQDLTFLVVRSNMTGLINVGERQRISSLLTSRVPVGYTDAEWLTQQAVERMVYAVVRRTVTPIVTPSEGGPHQYRWESMAWALNGWLQRELTGWRSPWHAEAAARFAEAAHGSQLIGLGTILPTATDIWPTRAQMMHNYMMAESVINFVAATHGKESIADLTHSLPAHQTWDDLIPSVFNVPKREFEAEWNIYLRLRPAGTPTDADFVSKQGRRYRYEYRKFWFD